MRRQEIVSAFPAQFKSCTTLIVLSGGFHVLPPSTTQCVAAHFLLATKEQNKMQTILSGNLKSKMPISKDRGNWVRGAHSIRAHANQEEGLGMARWELAKREAPFDLQILMDQVSCGPRKKTTQICNALEFIRPQCVHRSSLDFRLKSTLIVSGSFPLFF